MRWALAATLFALAGCSRAPAPLPVYAEVPEFGMTAQTGEPFHSELLKGKIWVADFIFTTCTGPCPRMSAQMRRLQEELGGMPEVKLVSFTVDPATDTPDVLAAYAKRFRAEPGRWYFLTGPEATLAQLDKTAFKLGNEGRTHSTRFVLVDRRGRIRGYYGASEQDSLKQLLADIRRLVKEPA